MLATTTEQPSELDKENPSISNVPDAYHANVFIPEVQDAFLPLSAKCRIPFFSGYTTRTLIK